MRTRRNLTLQQVVSASGVSMTTVNQIERGHRKPYKSTVFKLAIALDQLGPRLKEEEYGWLADLIPEHSEQSIRQAVSDARQAAGGGVDDFPIGADDQAALGAMRQLADEVGSMPGAIAHVYQQIEELRSLRAHAARIVDGGGSEIEAPDGISDELARELPLPPDPEQERTLIIEQPPRDLGGGVIVRRQMHYTVTEGQGTAPGDTDARARAQQEGAENGTGNEQQSTKPAARRGKRSGNAG